MPDYPRNAFAGTATDYARYRPPYPSELLAHLRARLGDTEKKTLLDLGCGPGRLTFALAPFFARAVAIDREPEMIAEAIAQAKLRGVQNVEWRVSDAEILEFPEAHFAAVTSGEAFHRLDERIVVKRILTWLEPGGGLAILGSHPRDAISEWQRALEGVVRKFRRAFLPGETALTKDIVARDIAQGERVFEAAGFVDVASFTFKVAYEWALESLMGYLHSTSYCARVVLGEREEEFERELTKVLSPFGPSFAEQLEFGYTFARKPARPPSP